MKRLAPLFLIALLVGCGGPKTAPAATAVTPPADGDRMRKPKTVDEQIALIQGSSAPEEKKQAAIAHLRSGQR